MITHEQLLSMWEEDAGIDKVNLDREATNIPKLHHKYLTILLDIRAKKIAYNHKLEELKKEKELYYVEKMIKADVVKEKSIKEMKKLVPEWNNNQLF